MSNTHPVGILCTAVVFWIDLTNIIVFGFLLNSHFNREYKDVTERHRVKMIEHETTQIVVTDLDKYYDALDKALLRYHGMKIADINKIIRELWTLTYKGEDITNIEIVSGQDAGSRANTSYNYRYVHLFSSRVFMHYKIH